MEIKKQQTKSCGCFIHRKGTNNPCYTGYQELSGTYWCPLKNSAKKRNILFDISIQDAWNLFITQNRLCVLTGVKLTLTQSDKVGDASLDRIDSFKGYIKGNVQWIHKDIQWMKNNFPEQQFIKLCHQVAAYNPL